MSRSITTITSVLGAILLLSACSGEKAAEATAPAAAANAIGEVIVTKTGAVKGATVTDIGLTAFIYKGIPYAAPPVGDLRWKAPQPAAAWEGERAATEWSNRCPQGQSSMGAGTATSEDCLYLNVVTAAKTADDKQPVMVFFHGGGLTSGASASTTYNHPGLPNKGVVVVTVNSRLGPMGYLAHPVLTAEGPGSGNYGTLDLAASLGWIRDNIAAFGGDPGNVTIFGESGGGSKVISQMATPSTDGLFHKAIVESGSALATADRSLKLADAEALGKKLAAAVGVKDGPNALAELRAIPWEKIQEAGSDEKVGFRASPAVDGKVIPKAINEMFKAGEQRKVPLIVGGNQGEAMLQTSVPEMANMHSKAGSPTWVYNFTHLPVGWKNEKGCVAFHGLELTYVFGAAPLGLSSPTTLGLARGGGCTSAVPATDDVDLKVASEAATVWAQFARTGNPSVPGLIDWPAYTEANNAYLDIGNPLTAKTNIQASYVAPPPRPTTGGAN
jgi:para-nitrobenzyl esterase